MSRARALPLLVIPLVLAACGSSSPSATTTTTAAVTTTTSAPAAQVGGAVYLLHNGTTDQPGPFLVPVWTAGADTPRAAVTALLAGPPSMRTNPLASPAFSTGVPTGTRLLGLSVTGATATVDLSAAYGAGGGSTAMLSRLAQMAFTVTQFPGIDRMALHLDGRAVTTFSSEGIEIGAGVSREFFSGTGLVPRILVDHPAVGEPVSSPFWLSGRARDVSGASFGYELTRGGEDVLARGTVPAALEAGWTTFRRPVDFTGSGRQRLDLVVHLEPPAAPSYVLQVPFYVQGAAAGAPTCSAAGLPATVAPEDGLPAAPAAMRRDIAAAAVRCDFDALVALGDRNGTGLRVSWGGPTDTASMWRGQETDGTGLPPMWYLRKLLDLPYGLNTTVPAGQEAYVWPAAAAGPEPPTEAQLEEVAAAGLYTLDELHAQMRAVGGYTGYRIFVSARGDWQAFVSGD